MIFKNDVFEAVDGCLYRVLKPTTGPDRGWVINITREHQWPIERDFGVLRQHSPSRAPGARQALPDFAFYSEKLRTRAYAAYDAIKPLLYSEDGTENLAIYDEHERSRLARKRADELGMSKNTVYRYLHLWWSQGQSVVVLVPGYTRSGKNQAKGTGRKGRRPDDGRYPIFQMGPDDIKFARKIIEKEFLKKPLATLTDVHADLCDKQYSFVDGNGERHTLPEGERPSIHQVRGVLKRYFTPEQSLRAKKGDKEFEREHNALLGSSQEECVGVGHIYEIDATIADVFLVAIANRADIIGKPTLYLIYDRKSRLCVGFYVGLENASWTGAMLAILSIATDKRALCARYNVPYDPNDWPADGVFPAKFLGDRGEMASKNSDRICDGMESTVSNTQSLLPIRKGLVECGFKLTHQSIKNDTPGYEPPFNAKKRRAIKYHLDAALTLDEFVSNILHSIIKHNRTVMKGYPLPSDYVLDGTPAIPRVLWEEDIVHNTGSVSRYSYEYLHKQLLPRGQATVTQHGIDFEGCMYGCGDNTVRQWMITAGMNGTFKVKCSYDPRLADSIIIYSSSGESFTCSLTGDSKGYAGYSFAEVKYILVEKRKLDKAQADNTLQEKVRLKRHIRGISAPAVKAARAATAGIARSARRADTAAARNEEKTRRRRTEVVMPRTSASLDPKSNVISLTPRAAIAESSRDGIGGQQDKFTVTPINPLAPAKSSVAEFLRRKAQEMTNELVNQ